VNAQILSPSGSSAGIGFAIPVNIAKRIIPQLIQYGAVRRPKLGASLISVGDVIQQGYRLPVQNGLLVRQPLPGGSADKAGIHGISSDGTIGDIILSGDGQKLDDLDDLYRLLDRKAIGDTINLEVFRGGKTVTIPVKLYTSPPQTTRRPMQ